MKRKCNAVFAGGVRGIGHAGAILAMEEAGHTFENLAGSSAAAVAAAPVAAGYSGGELRRELPAADYIKFKHRDRLCTLAA